MKQNIVLCGSMKVKDKIFANKKRLTEINLYI